MADAAGALALLAMPPAEREEPHVDAIAELLIKDASYFTSQLAEDQLIDICRRCHHLSLAPGAPVCTADEAVKHFFVLLRGGVIVEEPAVHHRDLATSRRQRNLSLIHI